MIVTTSWMRTLVSAARPTAAVRSTPCRAKTASILAKPFQKPGLRRYSGGPALLAGEPLLRRDKPAGGRPENLRSCRNIPIYSASRTQAACRAELIVAQGNALGPEVVVDCALKGHFNLLHSNKLKRVVVVPGLTASAARGIVQRRRKGEAGSQAHGGSMPG